MNTAKISGIEFEAVRKTRPIPHWLPKVVSTGYVFGCGIFDSGSRPKMWESMRYMRDRLGEERFVRETLEATDCPQSTAWHPIPPITR
jgi:hypothetical protein